MKTVKMTIINKSYTKKFIIKTEDSYGEKTFEIVRGEKSIKNFGAYKKYSYEGKQGKCEIIFIDNSISIIREDFFNNNFEISFNGSKNKFFYKNEFINEELYSLGENFFYDEEKKIFSFSYQLFDSNHNKLNRIEFSIKEV